MLLNQKYQNHYNEYFNKALENAGVHTETGIFGAMMKVSLINDGQQRSSWTVKKSYSHKAKKRSVKIVSFNHDKKHR